MSSNGPVRLSEQFGGETIEVIYRPSPEPVDPAKVTLPGLGFYPPLNVRTYVENGIEVDQDVAVEVRDGVRLYVDVHRPVGGADLPALLSWSFYGKRPGDNTQSPMQIPGVPPGTVSNMTKFEGPDPAYWCKHGYAVINVDSRGAGNSEGNLVVWGEQDGRDGHDVVEWVAQQPWSNGKVGMAGNSGLAMSQWWIAAERPEHLAAIAPWEGTSDLYREFVCEGGIPAPGFNSFVMGETAGPGLIEDYVAMLAEYPLMNAYWQSKIPRFAEIGVPAYLTAGWSHLHLRGAFNAFTRIQSPQKWLRVHREFEWPDHYSWWNLEDLRRFFDRYLRDVHNGWEMTPAIRLEVMDARDQDFQSDRPEAEWPLARTEYHKLFLDARSGSMGLDRHPEATQVAYDPATGAATFDMRFEEDTELTGHMRLRLWVEADGHDEMDLFVNVQKLDTQGAELPTSVLGQDHPGAWGKLRVSHRELDAALSTDHQPVHSHRAEQKLASGEVVPVDIEIYPHSRIWHAGQQLRVLVAGRYLREGWFEPFSWDTDNAGRHVIHTGGEFESFLQVPVVPPKYQDGDYVRR